MDSRNQKEAENDGIEGYKAVVRAVFSFSRIEGVDGLGKNSVRIMPFQEADYVIRVRRNVRAALIRVLF